MSTNNTFSFSRLGLVMKRDLMENWKVNLYRFLGPYAVLLFAMLVGCLRADGMDDFREFSHVIFTMFTSILFLGSIYSASQIMETMDTQQKRVSYLMFPATSLEKFVVRALYVTVGFVVMATLAFLLAEVSRFLFMPFLDLPESFHQPLLSNLFSDLGFLADTSATTTSNTWPVEQIYSIFLGRLCSLLYMAWMHSFFILGGCYWHKHPFWKTLGCLILANVLVLTALGNILVYISKNNWEKYHESLESIFGGITINQSLTFWSIILLLLVILNWWLSYRCFTRSQVIKPKFRLL